MSNYHFDMDEIYPDPNLPQYNQQRMTYQGKQFFCFAREVYDSDRSNAFKKAMKKFAKQHPDIMEVSKSGNGANVNVGELHIGSQGTTTIGFNLSSANIYFRIGYDTIETFDIDTTNKLFIINGRVAIHYDN